MFYVEQFVLLRKMFHVEHLGWCREINVPRGAIRTTEYPSVPRGAFGLPQRLTFHVEQYIA